MSEFVRNAILFEDNLGVANVVIHILDTLGWQVMSNATSMKEAFELIEHLTTIPSVAFIDGNLSDTTNGEDGKAIARELLSRYPQIKRVGFSAQTPQPGMDYQFGKGNASIEGFNLLLSQIEQEWEKQEK